MDDEIILKRVLEIVKEWREAGICEAGNFQGFLLNKLGHEIKGVDDGSNN